MSVSFFVAGEPKPQPRAKAFGRGGFIRMYTPYTKDAKAWRSAVIAEAMAMEIPTITDALAIRLTFILPRPKSHFLKSGLRPDAPKHPITRPDTDNLAKLVMDALGEAGVWSDDSAVCSTLICKHYPNKGGSSVGCHIEIEELT